MKIDTCDFRDCHDRLSVVNSILPNRQAHTRAGVNVRTRNRRDAPVNKKKKPHTMAHAQQSLVATIRIVATTLIIVIIVVIFVATNR